MPSGYLARERVEVGGQAGPSFPRGYVGDVAAPHAVPLLDVYVKQAMSKVARAI